MRTADTLRMTKKADTRDAYLPFWNALDFAYWSSSIVSTLMPLLVSLVSAAAES